MPRAAPGVNVEWSADDALYSGVEVPCENGTQTWEGEPLLPRLSSGTCEALRWLERPACHGVSSQTQSPASLSTGYYYPGVITSHPTGTESTSIKGR